MKPRKTFKERWIEIDEHCEHCGNITKESVGLTKQNVKKLFRKPTTIDVALLIIIILTILGSFVYLSEVQSLREIIKYPAELCEFYYSNVIYTDINNISTGGKLNLTSQW